MIEITRMEAIADRVSQALKAGVSIDPISAAQDGLSLADSYQIAASVAALHGSPIVGRKIGFTNRAIWPEFGVKQPMWGPVFASSFTEMANCAAEAALTGYPEPKIEPEIVLKVGADLDAQMTEAEIFDRIEWIAPGFEIVRSIYPHWSFKIEDAIMAGGLHAHLYCGTPISSGSITMESLTSFSITLSCNGETMDNGIGSNVLGGPIQALRYLLEVLDKETPGNTVARGEVITTGTLTQAFNIKPGEHWAAQFEEVPLSAISLTMT